MLPDTNEENRDVGGVDQTDEGADHVADGVTL